MVAPGWERYRIRVIQEERQPRRRASSVSTSRAPDLDAYGQWDIASPNSAHKVTRPILDDRLQAAVGAPGRECGL